MPKAQYVSWSSLDRCGGVAGFPEASTHRLARARLLVEQVRIVLDWTVALFFRPDITRVDLRVERDQVQQQASELASPSARSSREVHA